VRCATIRLARPGRHTACSLADRVPLPRPAAPARAGERTPAWRAHYRPLTICHERLVAVHRGFLPVACALVGWNYVRGL
jgi:hypothetical protein